MSDTIVDTFRRQAHIYPLQYNGKIRLFYKIYLFNFIFKILTLGIFTFWGTTRLRKYIISSIQIGEDPFEYTGRGIELFKGFLKALGFFLIYLIVIVSIEYAGLTDIKNIVDVCIALLTWPLIFIAQYSALRYQICRLKWRGIRMSLGSSSIEYARLILKRSILDILSLGLTTPMTDHLITLFLVKHFYFGDIQATFYGKPAELKKVNIITVLLLIPTLGMSRFWYGAALLRYRTNNLRLGNMSFSSDFQGKQVFIQFITNAVLFLCSVGLAFPYILHRKLRFISQHVQIKGDLNALKVHQREKDNISSAEGLANILDADLALI